MGMVGRRRSAKIADWLKPGRLSVFVDEGDHCFDRWSSSAIAKSADTVCHVALNAHRINSSLGVS
jgi:hypothetical protein